MTKKKIYVFVFFEMYFTLNVTLCSVSALKPEEMPEVRLETEERQSAGYEVHHQKLV